MNILKTFDIGSVQGEKVRKSEQELVLAWLKWIPCWPHESYAPHKEIFKSHHPLGVLSKMAIENFTLNNLIFIYKRLTRRSDTNDNEVSSFVDRNWAIESFSLWLGYKPNKNLFLRKWGWIDYELNSR